LDHLIRAGEQRLWHGQAECVYCCWLQAGGSGEKPAQENAASQLAPPVLMPDCTSMRVLIESRAELRHADERVNPGQTPLA
jgi:hypothetical protein